MSKRPEKGPDRIAWEVEVNYREPDAAVCERCRHGKKDYAAYFRCQICPAEPTVTWDGTCDKWEEL